MENILTTDSLLAGGEKINANFNEIVALHTVRGITPIVAINPRTDARLISGHWARFRTGVTSGSADSGGSGAQLVTGGPADTSGTGPLWNAAGGGHPAHWLTGAGRYWDAPNKAAYNFLHKKQTGYGFEWGPIFTIKALIQVPVTWSNESAWILDSNGLTSTNLGFNFMIDSANGPIAVNAQVTNTSENVLSIFGDFQGAVYSNPYSVVPGMWQLYTMEVSYGSRDWHACGYVHGLPASSGVGNVGLGNKTYNALTGEIGGSFGAADSHSVLRFFNSPALPSTTQVRVAMILFWGCILTKQEHASYDKYICETEGIPGVANILAEREAYIDQPDYVELPNNRLLIAYQKKRHNVDWAYQSIPARESRNGGETWSEERIIWSYGKGVAAIGSGVSGPLFSLIDDVLWQVGYEDDDPVYLFGGTTRHIRQFVRKSLDYGATWSGPVYVSGGYSDGRTAGEGKIIKAADSALLMSVYAITGENNKVMASTNGGATWTIRSSIAAGYEAWLLRVGTDIVVYYDKISDHAIYSKYSTDHGVTWSAEEPVVDTGLGGRPVAKLLASGGIIVFVRGTGGGRLFVVYVSPANVAAKDYHLVGGIMRRDTSVGGYNGVGVIEPSPGLVRIALGIELTGLGTPYCEIRDRIFIQESVIAQYGVTVSPEFTPSDYGVVLHWYKAPDGADEDLIENWTTSAGAVNPLTQTGTSRPKLKTNIIEGKSVVRFDGVNDSLNFTTDVSPEAVTIFAVMNTTATIATPMGFLSRGDTTGLFGSIYFGDFASTFTGERMTFTGGALSGRVGISYNSDMSGWHVYAWKLSGQTESFFIDGVLAATSVSDSGHMNSATTTRFNNVNVLGKFGEVDPFTGDLRQLVFFSEALSNSNILNASLSLLADIGL